MIVTVIAHFPNVVLVYWLPALSFLVSFSFLYHFILRRPRRRSPLRRRPRRDFTSFAYPSAFTNTPRLHTTFSFADPKTNLHPPYSTLVQVIVA